MIFRGVVIVLFMGRWPVPVIHVLVVADVEVEVEEAGAQLAVPVPVAGGVKTETAETDDGHHTQDWAEQAKDSNHGFAKASHLRAPV
jgi:hypothetical protein